MEYRELALSEIDLIRGIDRSEKVDSIYRLLDGSLLEVVVNYDVKGFKPDELEAIIRRQKKLLYNGGWVFGAFGDGELVGVASLENRFRGIQHSYCKMDILFVSREHRRRGIASVLLRMCLETAGRVGADHLYISATESKNTVDFYMHREARLVGEPDEELLRMEPEDIHLEVSVPDRLLVSGPWKIGYFVVTTPFRIC
jgi:GNAT superfamily N-acetyltransferase